MRGIGFTGVHKRTANSPASNIRPNHNEPVNGADEAHRFAGDLGYAEVTNDLERSNNAFHITGAVPGLLA